MAGNAVDPETFRADAAVRRALRELPGAAPACRTACFNVCTSVTRTPRKSFAIRASTSSPSPARSRAGMPCNAPLRNVSSASGLELGGCDPVYVRHDAESGARHRERRRRRVLQQRSIVLRPAAHLRARAHLRRVRRRLRRAHAQIRARQSARSRARRSARSIRTAAADTIRQQIAASVRRRRASPRSTSRHFPASKPGTPYLAPQVLLDVDHSMPVMREEIFGPVAGLMKVSSDEQAIALMNDTAYGLTAAIWTARRRTPALCDRRSHRHRHLVHESLRLSRPGARVGGRQGLRPRLHAVGRSATNTSRDPNHSTCGRAPESHEVMREFSSAGAIEAKHHGSLRGNWNYPTRCASARAASPSCPTPARRWE